MDSQKAEARQLGYVVAVIVNAVMLYAGHHLLSWGVPFVTGSFDDVLWALDLSLGTAIAANAFYLVYDATWLRRLCQIGLDITALVWLSALYRVFPFAFPSPWWNDFASWLLTLVMLALIVAMVVHTIMLGLEVLHARGIRHDTAT